MVDKSLNYDGMLERKDHNFWATLTVNCPRQINCDNFLSLVKRKVLTVHVKTMPKLIQILSNSSILPQRLQV